MNGKAQIRSWLPLTLTLAVLPTACAGDGAGSATARSAGDGRTAAGQSDAAPIVACDLVTTEEVEAFLGSLSLEPDSDEAEFGSMKVSGCTFFGTNGILALTTWHPFSSGESTSAAWAARVRAERGAVDGSGPMERGVGEITAYEGLSVPAALEDSRADLGIVALHTLEHRHGGVYLLVTAPDPDIARAVTEKALIRLP